MKKLSLFSVLALLFLGNTSVNALEFEPIEGGPRFLVRTATRQLSNFDDFNRELSQGRDFYCIGRIIGVVEGNLFDRQLGLAVLNPDTLSEQQRYVFQVEIEMLELLSDHSGMPWGFWRDIAGFAQLREAGLISEFSNPELTKLAAEMHREIMPFLDAEPDEWYSAALPVPPGAETFATIDDTPAQEFVEMFVGQLWHQENYQEAFEAENYWVCIALVSRQIADMGETGDKNHPHTKVFMEHSGATWNEWANFAEAYSAKLNLGVDPGEAELGRSMFDALRSYLKPLESGE